MSNDNAQRNARIFSITSQKDRSLTVLKPERLSINRNEHWWWQDQDNDEQWIFSLENDF